MATLNDLVFDYGVDGIIHHGAHIYFDNGYGASVIFGQLINMWGSKPFELAVLKINNNKEWELCYDTPITDDVIQNLDEDQVNEYLKQIEALPNVTR